MSGSKKIPARWMIAIAALVAGQTQQDAAKAAGVNVSTMRRWYDDLTFAATLAQAQQEIRDRVISQVVDRAGSALNTLEAIHENQRMPSTPRVSAATQILRIALAAWKSSELNHAIVVVRAYGYEVKPPEQARADVMAALDLDDRLEVDLPFETDTEDTDDG